MTAKSMTVLFQGDSITDAGRARGTTLPPNAGLGTGYPLFVAGRALNVLADQPLCFHNRGISGNRVVDLYARWKSDALNLSPDVISILIGVNDTWHEFGSQNGVEVDRYAQIYHMLLSWTREVLPQVKLVLCEPFVLPIGAVAPAWLPEIAARSEIVKNLAKEFQTVFVPLQQVFDKALERAPAAHWLADGVHPTPAGHVLIADAWLATAGNLLGAADWHAETPWRPSEKRETV